MNRSLVLVLLLLMSSAWSGRAAEVDVAARSAAATAAYHEGDYEAAAAIYTELLASEATGPTDVLFDLGNCAFRRGEFAEAALLYRRVLRHAPRDDEARFQLGLTERRLGLEGPATPSPAVVALEWFDGLSFSIRWSVVFALQLLGWAWLVGRRSVGGTAGAIGLVALGLALAIWSGRHAVVERPQEAVVLIEGAVLRVDPHRERSVVRPLRRGELVEVAEASDRWVRVIAPTDGWIDRSALGLVE